MTNTATLPTESTETTPSTTAVASDQTTLGILSLVSGIIGVLGGMIFPLSIVAIVLGILALQREPRSRTMATWGIVTGALPFAIGLLALAAAAVFFVPLGLLGGLDFGGFDFDGFSGFLG